MTATPEPCEGQPLLRDLYHRADPGFAGRVTVPVLWDRQERTIVDNEWAVIMRLLGHAFDASRATRR